MEMVRSATSFVIVRIRKGMFDYQDNDPEWGIIAKGEDHNHIVDLYDHLLEANKGSKMVSFRLYEVVEKKLLAEKIT